jgi:hypothetical protein
MTRSSLDRHRLNAIVKLLKSACVANVARKAGPDRLASMIKIEVRIAAVASILIARQSVCPCPRAEHHGGYDAGNSPRTTQRPSQELDDQPLKEKSLIQRRK